MIDIDLIWGKREAEFLENGAGQGTIGRRTDLPVRQSRGAPEAVRTRATPPPSQTRRLRILQNLRMDMASAAMPRCPDFSAQESEGEFQCSSFILMERRT